MYSLKVIVKPKQDIYFKDSYEKISKLIRYFISQNNKELKKRHYQKKFSNYVFDQLVPFEENGIYKKDVPYTFEIKTIEKEFKDLKNFKGLESDDLKILSVTFTPIFYKSKGHLISKTPVFLGLGELDDVSLDKFKEKIRENMLFKYLKNGHEKEDIQEIRNNLIKDVQFVKKQITIPFPNRVKGNDLLYHCYHVKVFFKDHEHAKNVEKIIYGTGLGKMTSNGFGYME